MSTIPESHRDLLASNLAMPATFAPDGYLQVTAIGFLLDDDGEIRLSLNTARQKVKNLRAHPECTLFILDLANPLRTLEIRARAEIQPDDDYAFADTYSRRSGFDVRTMDRPGETRVVVTLRPVKVNAIDLSR
jgi:PPOX class probable F420-dependent enzyme